MTWVLLIGAGWLLGALLVGVLIGRSIRLADRKEARSIAAEAATPNFVVDPDAPAELSTEAASSPDDAATSERVRHSIPGARPPTARKPVRTERRSSPHRPGRF